MDLNKLNESEILRLKNFELAIDNLNLKLFILNHDRNEFIKELEKKYKEKKNGNDI